MIKKNIITLKKIDFISVGWVVEINYFKAITTTLTIEKSKSADGYHWSGYIYYANYYYMSRKK